MAEKNLRTTQGFLSPVARLIRFVPPAMTLLPFVLACTLGKGIPKAQATAQSSIRPALAFDQYLVNLGPVELRQYHYARFGFTNTSNRTIEITDLKPSCGCLNPQLEKRVYGPQESGEFFLRVQSASVEAGEKEYTCQVLYDDVTPQIVDLAFKLELPEKKVTVQPKSLVFYQFNDNETKQDIVVTNFRSKRMDVLDVECSSKLVRPTIGDVIVDEFGNRQHVVSVKVGHVPPGRHQALVTIFTDDPVFPELRVPILIVGPEGGVQPASFEVDTSVPARPQTQQPPDR